MTRASACGSSWLSVESRRVALATIATPSRADAPRRRPVAAVRHATAAEAPPTHWAGRQKARAALASATRLMSESDRASFAAYDVEFVVEISRCRAPLHRSTTHAVRHAVDVELYSSTLLYSAPERSTSLQLYSALHSTSSTPSLRRGAAAASKRARAARRRACGVGEVKLCLLARASRTTPTSARTMPPSHLTAKRHRRRTRRRRAVASQTTSAMRPPRRRGGRRVPAAGPSSVAGPARPSWPARLPTREDRARGQILGKMACLR